MPPAIEDLVELSKDALASFFQNEAANIASGTSERNLCGRLALEVSKLLPVYGLERYYADIEYNRKQGGEIKTILDDEMQVIPITCDLIVHSRGKILEADNLIAFEMKKSTRPDKEKNADRDRLKAMTKASYDDIWSNDGVTHPEHVCGYQHGVYIEIDILAQEYLIEEYQVGALVTERNGDF